MNKHVTLVRTASPDLESTGFGPRDVKHRIATDVRRRGNDQPGKNDAHAARNE